MPEFENLSPQTPEPEPTRRRGHNRASRNSRNRIHIAPHSSPAVDYFPSGKIDLPDMKKAYARFRAEHPELVENEKPKPRPRPPRRNIEKSNKSGSEGLIQKFLRILGSLFGGKSKEKVADTDRDSQKPGRYDHKKKYRRKPRGRNRQKQGDHTNRDNGSNSGKQNSQSRKKQGKKRKNWTPKNRQKSGPQKEAQPQREGSRNKKYRSRRRRPRNNNSNPQNSKNS